MLESPILEGLYVRLEPLTLQHLDGLIEAASWSRETFTLTGVPFDRSSMRDYIHTALEERALGTSVPYATIDKGGDKVAGSTRFMRIQFWNWQTTSSYQRGESLPDALEIGATWLALGLNERALTLKQSC
jgi:hypothetical protein